MSERGHGLGTMSPLIERNQHVSQNRFPTWMVVVSVIILLPVIVVGLSAVMHLVAALSIGAILLIVFIVWLFTKIRSEVDGT